jgi:hypothetical protein
VNLTRRRALTAGALAVPALAAACTSKRQATPAPPVNPDDALRAAALVRERTLVAAYRDALAGVPTLQGKLGPLLADHETHLAALGEASATASSTVAPSTPVASRVTPTTAAAALAKLRSLEHTAAAAHATAAITASRRLAATLASLAACEASHRVAL